jgi:hypothetical protein
MLPQQVRRGAAYRSACLALGTLCLLAALAGTVGRSGPTAHHRAHAVAAAALGYDVQAGSHRTGLDAVPGPRAVARTSAAPIASIAASVSAPRAQAPDTVRTRGPPAPA